MFHAGRVFCDGNSPSIYLIQIIYYSFSLFMFVLAVSYSTCAIVIFFRDLTQLINIGLQVGMWATPILWQIESVPEIVQRILKINPLFYIVNGYRMLCLNISGSGKISILRCISGL